MERYPTRRALEIMVDMDNKWNEINRLRNEANDLIEQHLPQMWKDGDVRYLAGATFDKIQALVKRADELEGKKSVVTSFKDLKKKLVFKGQFGEIEIRDARQLREDLTKEKK